jgi:cytochrome c oxidase accessory protein FixG
MIAAFGLFTVTTIVGRLWCGYTCPQTVWTAIYMWMEQIAEGPRHQRMRLDQAPMSLTKLRKRAFKHAMWLGWAFFTGLTFVGYFTPIRELTADVLTLDVTGWAAFWTLFFTGATYVNAGWMREQVCKYMCPYARFQSAMFDKDTLIVSYDAARGEPRGSRKRGETQGTLGDCIDCQLCVQVCPTGIDIRNGLQYECIGCAHCIDACAEVMEKMEYPPGLIRYTTEHELSGGQTHWLRGRSVGYALVCVALMVAFGYALSERSPFAFDIIRERDTLYHLQADGRVRNDYQLKVMNKTQSSGSYTIRVASPESIRMISTDNLTIDAGEVYDTTMQLVSNDSSRANVKVEIEVCQDARCVREETRFLSPTGSAPR